MACSDGDACTRTDTCQQGTCIGASPVVCNASDQCHDAGTCDPASGACSDPAKANGVACSDGNACTRTDTCQQGTCVGASPVVCNASDQCHDAGTCDPASGTCSNPARGNGIACDDGDLCTRRDSCQQGACVGADPVVCTADACHQPGACDAYTGQCPVGAVRPDGTACADGTVCNGAEVCHSGICTAGTPIATEDWNPCTVDSCDPVTGAVHAPIAGCSGLPDLIVSAVADNVVVDPATMQLSGTVAVTIANVGHAPADQAFTVLVFDDRNSNKTFDQASDVQWGQVSVPALAAGQSVAVNVGVSGEARFPARNLIAAYADDSRTVAETDESNNFGDNTPACVFPPNRPMHATVEWAWSSVGSVDPQYNQVLMAPVVADLDGDHVPEVVFVSYTGHPNIAPGRLRAVDGRTGKDKVTFARPVWWFSAVAIGDLDRDGRPEVVATNEQANRLLAFEHDGTLKWTSAPIPMPAGAYGVIAGGAPSIADLNGDGAPEVIIGSVVLSGADGTLVWAGNQGRADKALIDNYFSGPLSVVADLDLDGRPEVVTGSTVYRNDGQIFWNKSLAEDGYPAVGNFDADPFPEVVVTAKGRVHLYQHDGTLTWTRVLPDLRKSGEFCYAGMGGAPAIGDADGDGKADIGVAGCSSYTVIRADGTVLWTRRINDLGTGWTSSTMFDFTGDGTTEIVMSDEQNVQVVEGKTGNLLLSIPNPNGTWVEQAIVADVDGDGQAEIVAGANDYVSTGPTGLRVFGDLDGGWRPTRPIWNQYSYHVTNVNDDSTIPAHEANSWQSSNTYRQNTSDLRCH